MRRFLSVLLVALFTVSTLASASARGRGPKRDAKSDQSAEKKKAVDAEYRKALQRIPDSNEKPDPWKVIRSH